MPTGKWYSGKGNPLRPLKGELVTAILNMVLKIKQL